MQVLFKSGNKTHQTFVLWRIKIYPHPSTDAALLKTPQAMHTVNYTPEFTTDVPSFMSPSSHLLKRAI